MDNEELWRSVPAFEGIYEVSSVGRVRSLDRLARSAKREPQMIKGRLLKPGRASTGYFTVALCRDGSPRSYTVHELVAAAFIGPRPDGLDIDHKDGDRTNNVVSNLRYVTTAVNLRNLSVVNAQSGYRGVSKNGSGWCAGARMNRKYHYLGTYRTREEAADARARFERETNFSGLGAEPKRI